MTLTQEQAQSRITEKIEANGGQPVKVEAQPKGDGVWLAEVQLQGSDEVRQGVFTDEDLAS